MTTSEPSGPVFDALADPTRREVLRRLAREGPASATGLASSLPVSRQAVAKHLAALEGAGLVEGHRRGRERLYRLRPAPLTEATAWMSDVATRWDQRLEALRRLVEE